MPVEVRKNKHSDGTKELRKRLAESRREIISEQEKYYASDFLEIFM